MNTLKAIFRTELNSMDHEPEKVYERIVRWPEVDWENIYFRLLDHLETQVDLDTVPEDLVQQTLDEIIDNAKGSDWAENMLWEARHWWEDQQQKTNNPYKYHGVERSFFL